MGLQAKNCEASYSNGQEKTRKTEIGDQSPPVAGKPQRSAKEQPECWNDGERRIQETGVRRQENNIRNTGRMESKSWNTGMVEFWNEGKAGGQRTAGVVKASAWQPSFPSSVVPPQTGRRTG